MTKSQSRRERKYQSRTGGSDHHPPSQSTDVYWCDNQQSQCQDQYPTCGGGRECGTCGSSYDRCKCNYQRGGEVPVGDYCDSQGTQCSDNFVCATGGGYRDDETYRLYKQYKRLYKKAKRDVVLGATKVVRR